jgi:ketosteroid isomerase-like protein
VSQANVDLVRSLYALGTPDMLEADKAAAADTAFDSLLHADFEVRFPPDWPEGTQVFRGREGAAEQSAALADSWAEWRVEPEEYLDAGDHVVVFARMRARGVGSGAEVEFERTQVWGFREGRAAFMQVYVDREEALRAVGMGRG